MDSPVRHSRVMPDTPARPHRAARTPAHRRRTLDWTAVLFPLAVSVAANTAWAARAGDVVAIVAGVVTPILLVLAVERWHAHGGLEGWQRWTRLIAMVAVTGVTAAISWVHTTRLLLAHGWEWQLAYVAPLGVDGLAVLGTLALWPAATHAVTTITEPALERRTVDTALRTIDTAPRLRAVHADELDSLSRDRLREVARAEGVPVRGSRAEVAERVRAARVERDGVPGVPEQRADEAEGAS